MKNLRIPILASISSLVLSLTSCQKNESGNYSIDLVTSLAEMRGNQINFVTSSVEQGVSVESFNGNGSAEIISGAPQKNPAGTPGWNFGEANNLRFGIPKIDECVTISVSSSSYPREIIIEYKSGCSKLNRSGKVIINLSDKIVNEGAVQTIRYENFQIDNMKVDFEATLKNLGKNAEGHLIIEQKSLQTIRKGDEVTVRENRETKEWINGFETPDKTDNIFYITGSGTVTVNGIATYSRVITKPLRHESDCSFITEGIIELTHKASHTTIDYGDGSCDDKATVTAPDGTMETISLQSMKFKEGGHFDKQIPPSGVPPVKPQKNPSTGPSTAPQKSPSGEQPTIPQKKP